MNNPVRILLVDDSPHFLKAAREFLQFQDSLTVVDVASGEQEALAKSLAVEPDVILLDLNLDHRSGLELIPLFKKHLSNVKIIVLTMMDAESYRAAALGAGADGFVHKSEMTQKLQNVIFETMNYPVSGRAGSSKTVEAARIGKALDLDAKLISKLPEEIQTRIAITSSLLNSMAEGVLVEDVNGNILHTNQPFLEMLGYSSGELLGKHWSFMVTVAEHGKVEAQSKQRAANIAAQYETVFKAKDGRGIPVLVTATPVFQGGEFICTLATVMNLSKRKQAENKLQEREGHYRSILGDITELICRYLPDGTLTYVNDAYCRYFEKTKEELIGTSFIPLAANDFPQKIREHITSFTPDHPISTFEQYDILPDGKKRWREWVDRAIFDNNGRVIEFQSTGRDITDRKNAEQSLQESRAQLEGIINSAMDAIITIDEDQRILFFNLAAEQMYGCPANEAVGQSLTRFIPESIREDHGKLVRAFGLSDTSSKRSMKSPSLELNCVRADGRIFPSEVTISQIELGGRKIYTAIVRDITERKQAEEEIRRINSFNTALIHNMAEGIVVQNAEGVFTFMNPAVAEITGYSEGEFLGAHWTKYFPEDQHGIIREADDQRLTGKASKYETEFLHKSGKRITLLVSGSPLFEGGNFSGSMAVFTDITERKQTEKKIAASEAELRALFAAMQEVVILYDREGRYLSIASTNTPLLFKPPAEMVGKTLHEIMPAAQADLLADGIRRALDTGQTVQLDYNLNINEQERWFSGTISPVTGETAILVAHDVTDRKQAQAKIQQQVEHLTALREIDQAIAGSMDTHLVLDVALRNLLGELKVDAAAVNLFDPTTKTLRYETSLGFKTKALQFTNLHIGEGYAGKAALERRTIFIPNLQSHKTDFLRSPLFSREGFETYYGVPLIAKGEIKGVLEIFHRATLDPDADWLNFMEALAKQIAIAIDNSTLYTDLQRSNIELATAYDATINGWSKALDLRDRETEGHTQRVTDLTTRLAEKMNIDPREMTSVRRGALLHDIGKLGVPDSILLKAGKLTDEEWAIMRRHPALAYEMLLPISYLKTALDIPYCHHEKWDGTGYPRGLKGEEIPLTARIFAVVDVWDALTSDRPYRPAWTREQAIAYIREQAGKHFDPEIARAFLELIVST